MDELELLREYASVFGKGSRYYYYIFSKAGFTGWTSSGAETRRGQVDYFGRNVQVIELFAKLGKSKPVYPPRRFGKTLNMSMLKSFLR